MRMLSCCMQYELMVLKKKAESWPIVYFYTINKCMCGAENKRWALVL